jgi:hypothetical protein
VALMTLCGSAAAEPRREGFTGDLGLGFAVTSVPKVTVTISGGSSGGFTSDVSRTREARIGFAPLSLSLGGFLSPSVALLFRATGTSYFEDGDQFSHNFYGPVVELWPHDRFYLSGGVGFAVFGPNPFLSTSDVDPEGGWALNFRVGTALLNAENHDLTLSLEVIPGFYEDESVQGYALVAAWKWY